MCIRQYAKTRHKRKLAYNNDAGFNEKCGKLSRLAEDGDQM
jgi:hypothetical protein